jgi:hypothetical protein
MPLARKKARTQGRCLMGLSYALADGTRKSISVPAPSRLRGPIDRESTISAMAKSEALLRRRHYTGAPRKSVALKTLKPYATEEGLTSIICLELFRDCGLDRVRKQADRVAV